MWLLMIFWKTFRGMWRLVIGLIIGVVLYVVTFSTPSLEWIFNGAHDFSKDVMYWLRAQSWFGQYEKWDNLVKPGDRLPLIIYVLVGRFIWLFIEAILFAFPRWLIFGRSKNTTPLGENGIPLAYLDDAAQSAGAKAAVAVAAPAVVTQAASLVPPTQQPPQGQGTGLETAINTANVPAVPAEALASATSSKLAVGLSGLQEKIVNKE